MTIVRYAFRHLAKSRGFSLVAVVTLALGIGANTALFSIVDSIFLRPLPFAHPETLLHLTSSIPDRGFNGVPFSFPRYRAIRDGQRVFADLAVGTFTRFTLSGQAEPEQVGGFMASSNYLSVLGLQPALGRFFLPEDDRTGGAAVAVVSDAYWRRRFAGARDVLGRTITLDGRPHTIVGVLPPALSRFPLNQVEIWTARPEETPDFVPLQLENGAFGFEVMARLKPGLTLEQARADVKLLATAYGRANPKNVDAESEAHVNRLLDDLVGEQRQRYALLCGAVGCVLLIACANVANLLLARFTGRRKEIALHVALGATRGRVVRQLLAESLLIAAAGGALGLLVAQWGLGAFVSIGHDFIPRSAEISLNPTALGFTAAIALLTGLGMGFLPAWQASNQDVNGVLKEASRGSSQSRVQGRLRASLLVAEIALSLVLLIGASLLLTSFARLQRVTLGFRPEGVFVGFLNIPAGKYRSKPELASFYQRLVQRVAAIPGVASAAVNDAPPLSGNDAQAPVAVVGRPLPPLSQRPVAMRHLVSPGSFATLGMTLRSGRDFDERDDPNAPPTVIINEAFARRYFPNENPVGQKLVTGMAQMTAEIIGVAGDTRSQGLNKPAAPEYFLPALQRPDPFTALLVRTSLEPAALGTSVRAALREVDPDIPLNNGQAMTSLIARSTADRRLVMVLLAVFAALALVLAAVGVYSVMAYVVTQRTDEIGIRLALGATPSRVQAMVLGQGMRLVVAGIGLGLAAAFASSRVLTSLLFEVRPDDPLIYLCIAGIISGVAALACWLPARRATLVDPLIALRG